MAKNGANGYPEILTIKIPRGFHDRLHAAAAALNYASTSEWIRQVLIRETITLLGSEKKDHKKA